MHVEVYLEEPEKNQGVKRLSSVISYDGKKIKNYQELIDNTEFPYIDGIAVRQEIKEYVALKLEVSINIINIMN
jgi:hypothetical protein